MFDDSSRRYASFDRTIEQLQQKVKKLEADIAELFDRVANLESKQESK